MNTRLTCLIILAVTAATVYGRTYTTTFPAAESPISEGSQWLQGRTDGVDWYNVNSNVNKAYGETSPSSPQYTDPTAIFKGVWASSMTASGVASCVNPTDALFEEIEVRLHSNLSAHSSTGYECLWRCSSTTNAYAQIARWNGAVGSFNVIGSVCNGASCGVVTGDVVKCTISSSGTIISYKNGVQVSTASDTTWLTGNPGIGMNYGNGSSGTDFGFSQVQFIDDYKNIVIQMKGNGLTR